MWSHKFDWNDLNIHRSLKTHPMIKLYVHMGYLTHERLIFLSLKNRSQGAPVTKVKWVKNKTTSNFLSQELWKTQMPTETGKPDEYLMSLDVPPNSKQRVETTKIENSNAPIIAMNFLDFVRIYHEHPYNMIDTLPEFMRYLQWLFFKHQIDSWKLYDRVDSIFEMHWLKTFCSSYDVTWGKIQDMCRSFGRSLHQ